MRRDHKGIAFREAQARGDGEMLALLRPVIHAVDPDPAKLVCRVTDCGRRVHYVRRTYGPNGRSGFWQHTGDGLAQYRSWGVER